MWQPVALKALPGDSAINRLKQSAAGSAAASSPGMNHQLPHAREQNIRIVGVHGQIRATGVLVHEERLLPSLAAIGGAKYAALGLRSISCT